MESLRLLAETYLRAAWRRRWVGVIIAWLICGLGWVGVYLVPNQFESTARLYVDADAILTPLLKGLAADSSPTSELDVLQRTLLSRPNLEKLISKTDLDLAVVRPIRSRATDPAAWRRHPGQAANQEPVHHHLPQPERQAGARRGADPADDLCRERDGQQPRLIWRTPGASSNTRFPRTSSNCVPPKSVAPISARNTPMCCPPTSAPISRTRRLPRPRAPRSGTSTAGCRTKSASGIRSARR